MTKEEAKEEAKKAPSLWGGADSKLVLFMYNGGMSGMSISRALRIPYSRVLIWLKQEGVELRKRPPLRKGDLDNPVTEINDG